MSVNFSVPEHKHRIKPLTQILLNSLNHGIVDEASRFEIFLTFMWNYFQKCAFLCWKGILRLKVRSWAPEMHASNQVSRFWESIYKIWRATQHLGTHYPQLHPRGYGPTEETRAINETRRFHDYVCRWRKSLGRFNGVLAYQVNQCKEYRKSLQQRLDTVIKFIPDRGVEFRGDDETVRSPRKYFEKILWKFFSNKFS